MEYSNLPNNVKLYQTGEKTKCRNEILVWLRRLFKLEEGSLNIEQQNGTGNKVALNNKMQRSTIESGTLFKEHMSSKKSETIQVRTAAELITTMVDKLLPSDFLLTDHGVHFYPPFFTTDNLVTKDMIASYEEEKNEPEKQLVTKVMMASYEEKKNEPEKQLITKEMIASYEEEKKEPTKQLVTKNKIAFYEEEMKEPANQLVTKEMIASYEEEKKKPAKQWGTYNGIIAEQIVYYTIQNQLQNVFPTATLFHNIEMNAEKMSWETWQLLLNEPTANFENKKIGQFQFDFILVVPGRDKTIVFPIEVKHSTRENHIEKAMDQLENYNIILKKLFVNLDVEVQPCAVFISDDENKLESRDNTSGYGMIAMKHDIQVNIDDEFWTFFKESVEPTNSDQLENYINCNILILALNGFESKKQDRELKAGLEDESYCVTICNQGKTYFFNDAILNRGYLLDKLTKTLHNQAYLKTFTKGREKEGKHPLSCFQKVESIQNEVTRKCTSKFFTNITEQQAAVLNVKVDQGVRLVIQGPYGSGKTILLLIKACELIQEILEFKSNGLKHKCNGVVIVATENLIKKHLKPRIINHLAECLVSHVDNLKLTLNDNFERWLKYRVKFWDNVDVQQHIELLDTMKDLSGKLLKRCFFMDEAVTFERHTNHAGIRFRFVKVLNEMEGIYGSWSTVTSVRSSVSPNITFRALTQEGIYPKQAKHQLSRSLRSTPNIANLNSDYWSLRMNNLGLAYGPKIRDTKISPTEGDDINFVCQMLCCEIDYYHTMFNVEYRDILIVTDIDTDQYELLDEYFKSTKYNCSRGASSVLFASQLDDDKYAGLEYNAVIIFRRFEHNVTMAIKRSIMLLSIIRTYNYDIESPFVEKVFYEKNEKRQYDVIVQIRKQLTGTVMKTPKAWQFNWDQRQILVLSALATCKFWQSEGLLDNKSRLFRAQLIAEQLYSSIPTLNFCHELKIYHHSEHFYVIRINIYEKNTNDLLLSRLCSFYTSSPFQKMVIASLPWLLQKMKENNSELLVTVKISNKLLNCHGRTKGTKMKFGLDLSNTTRYLDTATFYENYKIWLESNEAMVWSVLFRKALWANNQTGVEGKIMFDDAATSTFGSSSTVKLRLTFQFKSKKAKQWRQKQKLFKQYYAHGQIEKSSELGWIQICTLEELPKKVQCKLTIKIL